MLPGKLSLGPTNWIKFLAFSLSLRILEGRTSYSNNTNLLTIMQGSECKNNSWLQNKYIKNKREECAMPA